MLVRRVTFDRPVWTKPLAFAADALSVSFIYGIWTTVWPFIRLTSVRSIRVESLGAIRALDYSRVRSEPLMTRKSVHARTRSVRRPAASFKRAFRKRRYDCASEASDSPIALASLALVYW